MEKTIINKTSEFVRKKLSDDCSGHDWWHCYRVYKIATRIGKIENADLFIVKLSALLHDISDWKFNNGDEKLGGKIAGRWLKSIGVDNGTISSVCEIIDALSFKGNDSIAKMRTLEGMVVQDADRLDAIGAIGIARAFAYGGYKHRNIYEPGVKPKKHQNFEQYKKNKGSTINHFYEKLLLLKGLMNTKTAKKIATGRHFFMENFLKEFFEEWDVSS